MVGANEQPRPAGPRSDVSEPDYDPDRRLEPSPDRSPHHVQANNRAWPEVVPPTPTSTPSTALPNAPLQAPPTHPALDHRSKSDTQSHASMLRREMAKRLKRSTTDTFWTMPEIMPEQQLFLDVIHNVDWSLTPLSSIETWPPRLEQTVNQILADTRPMAIYWGPSHTTIYNEAFSKLCGSKHPALLGKPVEDTWPEAEEELQEDHPHRLRHAARNRAVEQRFFIEREAETDGGAPWLEETHLKWSITPITEGNECLGFLHPVLDVTGTRLWERRMQMLIHLGEMLITARDVQSCRGMTLAELEAVERRDDIPLAILYSLDDGSGDPARPRLHTTRRTTA